MRRLARIGNLCLGILLACTYAHAGTSIRFIDEKTKAPLEYWVKETDLPGGGRMYFCLPDKVFVDEMALDWSRFGDQKALGERKKDVEDSGIDQIINEASGATTEPAVISDRKTDVQGGTGIQATVEGDFAAGAHVLQPGNKKFTINAGGAVEKGDAAVVPNGVAGMRVVCRPVDINLPTDGAPKTSLKIVSGGKTVLDRVFDSAKPSAVRIFLPIGGGEYDCTISNAGSFLLNIGKDGIAIGEHKSLEEGVSVVAEGWTVGIRRAEKSPKQDMPAAEAAAGPAEVWIFTDRNRRVWLEGETAEVSIRTYGDAKAEEVSLRLEDGQQKLDLGKIKLRRNGDAVGAEALLPTAPLHPGKYRLTASYDKADSNALEFEVASAMPATNMKLFTQLKWGPYSMEEKDLALLSASGLNLLSNGLCEGAGNISFGPRQTPLEAWSAPSDQKASASQATARSKHAPPELFDRLLPHARGMEYLLSTGVNFIPVQFSLILCFNVDDAFREQAEDRYQTVQHMAMELRRFPNLLGLMYTAGDGPTPATMGFMWGTGGLTGSFDMVHDKRIEKLKALFEKKVGKIDVDLADQKKLNDLSDEDKKAMAEHGAAWGFRVGEEIRTKLTGDDDKKIAWNQWVNDLYPREFRNQRDALSKIIDKPIVQCASTWGIGAGGGMYPGTFYSALDNPLNDGHGDYGICNFAYITGTDILSAGLAEGGKHPWVGLDMIRQRENASGYKLLLEALSRNPDGVGVLNLSDTFICDWAQDKAKSEELTRMMNIAKRFGDVFRNLQRIDEIGVVSSFRQEVLAGQPYRALYAAHYIASKAGYQANVVSDAWLEAHGKIAKERFKALFLVGMTSPLSPAMKDALTAFQEVGGVVIADEGTKADLKNMVTLPFKVPDSHGPSNMNSHLEFEEFFAPMIAQFRQTVGPKVTRFFDFGDATQFTGIRSADADVEYWTIFNDAKPQMKNGVEAQFHYAPASATARVARALQVGTVYDALRRQAVALKKTADNACQFDCDMTQAPGSIYLATDRPITALQVIAGKDVSPAGLLAMECKAVDDKNAPFAGKLPLEVVIIAPDGRERYRVYRTTNIPLQFKIAANDPAGKWTWRVTEQATGLIAEGTFSVAPPANPLIAAQPREDLVYDADAIREFLKHRDIQIVLFSTQPELAGSAEDLRAKLAAHGVKASVRTIWPSQLRPYPMQWEYTSIEDQEICDAVRGGDSPQSICGIRVEGKNHRGDTRHDPNASFYKGYIASAEVVYYHDVILLGRGDAPSNPMFDAIQRGKALARNISPSFPQAGRGLVGYAWAPFHYGQDAVVAYGKDEAGLTDAMAALVKTLDSEPQKQHAPALGREAEEGQVYAQMASRPAGETALVVGSKRDATSLWPTVWDREITGVFADADNVCIATRPLPAGPQAPAQFIAVEHGTDAIAFTGDALRGDAQSLADFLRGEKKRWTEHGIVRIDRRQKGAGGDLWAGGPDASIADIALGDDWIAPVGTGVGRFDPAGKSKWFFDVHGALGTYEEAKYPRICQRLALSGDGAFLAASFYDRTPTAGGEFEYLNRADTLIIDAASGKPAATIKNYSASKLALSGDGSRLVIVDETLAGVYGHHAVNPHGVPVVAWFSRDGKELGHVPIDPTVDTLALSADGRLAAISYTDGRRIVSVIDLETGAISHHPCRSADRGIALAQDGSAVVVSYSDGAIHRLGRGGELVYDMMLPAPGQATIDAKGQVVVACADAKVRWLDADGHISRELDFSKATAQKVDAPVARLADELHPAPMGGWLDRLGKDWKEESGTPLLADETSLEPGQPKTLVLDAPKANRWDVIVLPFTYQLKHTDDELLVEFSADGKQVKQHFGYSTTKQNASVALRVKEAGKVEVSFSSKSGGTLTAGKLVLLKAHGEVNAALTAKLTPGAEGEGSHENVPQVMVPNVLGLLGDPREEPMAWGLDAKAAGARGWTATDKFAPVDGKLYDGTVLYDATFRRGNLRSAQVVIEFAKPRPIDAIAIWEDPADLPTTAFVLECCDHYTITPKEKTLQADWKLICQGRGNNSYYHLHSFKPVAGKVWRYTILDIRGKAQRVAEIELFEEAMEDLIDTKD